MKNIAIILASGKGSRFGTSTPKQFVLLGGKPVILHTIEKFEKNDKGMPPISRTYISR